MSKKKSGSTTMTLKDFHGGSIPSDLPLPSAPGMSARLPDRLSAWGPSPALGSGAGGRSDLHHHRPRPGSAGSGGPRSGFGLEDRATGGPPFLPNPAHIGRHFDEDERKPFDAAAAPRRPVPAVAVPPPAPAMPASGSGSGSRSDQKQQQRPLSSPSPSPGPSPSPSPVLPAHLSPVSGGVGPVPNAWGVRKDVAVAPVEPPPPAQPTASLSSRFAQASAIEKITSGRWQSKPPDAEVIRFQETAVATESLGRRFGEIVRIGDDGVRDYVRERGRNVGYLEVKERGLVNGGWETDRVRSPVVPEVKERGGLGLYSEGLRSPVVPEAEERGGVGFYREEVRPPSNEGRLGGVAEVVERPKLKLLPRTKPVEQSEIWVSEEKQGYQHSADLVHEDHAHEMHGNANMPKPGSAGADSGGRVIERPKLNLKPRSQPVSVDESAVRARKTVFGGARPRELVLKERGVDNIASSNLEVTSPVTRVRNDVPKTDFKLEPAASASRYGERAESFPHEQRSGRDLDRKDYRTDLERVDVQRSTWRNDNRRNAREIEKPVEGRQEPDTWRKPVEQPKPEVQGPRYGKAASALELAQAFSRSVSDGRSDNRLNQKGLPGRTQVPFSRLTDTREFYSGTTQRHINGY